jgi:pimeloyl-ACP methyl ester carboxylesterase
MAMASGLGPLSGEVLPAGIRARLLPSINGLSMQVLEAGHETPGRPAILLLHGFPELAYSWRRIMLPLAAAGFHVIAPDQRGYGRTTGWDPNYAGDLRSFHILNVVRDSLSLVFALGYRSVAAVVGHDFGASVAAWCAVVRPDVFRSVVLMSAPFAGTPSFDAPAPGPAPRFDPDLAALPRPRKHYHTYYSTPQANGDMLDCPQGVHAFLRAYFHMKSADWKQNRPFKLKAWTAEELAKLPTYYVMDLDRDMAATVAGEMPSPAEIAACGWLTEEELRVYSAEYARTGFQGGLNLYRVRLEGINGPELKTFAGRTIDVPAAFISGKSDWGVYQTPGAFEAMQGSACTRMLACDLVEGAGHWVQQEQPAAATDRLLAFLRAARV